MLFGQNDWPLIMADAFTLGRSPLEPRSIISVQAKQLSSYCGNGEAVAKGITRFLIVSRDIWLIDLFLTMVNNSDLRGISGSRDVYKRQAPS